MWLSGHGYERRVEPRPYVAKGEIKMRPVSNVGLIPLVGLTLAVGNMVAQSTGQVAVSSGCMLSRVRTGMSNNEVTCALPAPDGATPEVNTGRSPDTRHTSRSVALPTVTVAVCASIDVTYRGRPSGPGPAMPSPLRWPMVKPCTPS